MPVHFAKETWALSTGLQFEKTPCDRHRNNVDESNMTTVSGFPIEVVHIKLHHRNGSDSVPVQYKLSCSREVTSPQDQCTTTKTKETTVVIDVYLHRQVCVACGADLQDRGQI